MNTFEIPVQPRDETRLREFLDSCTKTIDRHVQTLGRPIFELNDDEQQAVVDKINAYLEFELSQPDSPRNMRLQVTGTGLMLVCDETGSILGAEVISDGDIVTGTIYEMAALPVPPLESVLGSDGTEIPSYDQVLSPIILLAQATYKSGLMKDGEFQVVQDLTGFQIGVALAHRLEIQPAK